MGAPMPNPLVDGTPYRRVIIGGVPVPGRLQSVAGLDAEQDWNFQKSSGGNAAATSAAPAPAAQTGNIRQVNPPPAKTSAATGNTAGSFGISVWRGAKLAETITVTTRITTPDAHDQAIAFIKHMMPKRGKKPPTFAFTYPRAHDVGIDRVSIRKISAPEEKTAGKFDYDFVVVCCEYNPQKTAPAGQADPAKPPDEPKPKDAQEAELQNLLNKAKTP